ncbi:hypothetical protein BSLA_01r0008 [Burkholderia stabilis]|nr:hypothetical protein BSLA_01r0008 [Burkholderia stabilis]
MKLRGRRRPPSGRPKGGVRPLGGQRTKRAWGLFHLNKV